jgi:hypothetical protein
VSLTETSDRFTALPDEHTLAATVVALEEHGFSVEVVDDLDAARQAVLARIPHGASVMTNTSMTLTQAASTTRSTTTRSTTAGPTTRPATRWPRWTSPPSCRR